MNKKQLLQEIENRKATYKEVIRGRKSVAKQNAKNLRDQRKKERIEENIIKGLKLDLQQFNGDLYKYARLCTGMTREGAVKRFKELGVKVIVSDLHMIESGHLKEGLTDAIIDKVYFGEFTRIYQLPKHILLEDIERLLSMGTSFKLPKHLQAKRPHFNKNNAFLEYMIEGIENYF